MSEIQTLRQEIEAVTKEIANLNRIKEGKISRLHALEYQCGHSWGDPIPDHIYHEGYTCPGDAPGTMGVDFRGPCYVSPRTEKQWKRVCKKCGKVEYTKSIQTETVEKPKFY